MHSLPLVVFIWFLRLFSKDTFPHCTMASKTDSIASINTTKEDWNIVGRVVRLWMVSMGDKSRTTTSIELILADQQGSQIHASVRRLYVKKFERVLREGSVYSFRNFSLAANAGDYRITKHDWKINIQGNTKVVLLANNSVSLPPYVFTPLPDILDGLHDPSYLIDVMGILSCVGEERAIHREGNVTKMNVLELENEGTKITCALWGNYVDQLNEFMTEATTDTIIVALFGVKIKEFKGKMSLQNSMYSTRMVFNPQFNEAIELRRSVNSPVPFSQGVSSLTNSGLPSLEDDFLKMAECKTIAELRDLPDGCFIVLGTIEHLIEPDEWWYSACKCNRAAQPDTVAYYCNHCERRIANVTARYRIKVGVVDVTGSASFIIFDRAASLLFKKECYEMVDTADQDGTNHDCPPQILGLINREFLFKVDAKVNSSANFEPTYTAKRLTDDAELIKKFKILNAHKEIGFNGGSVSSSKEMANDLQEGLTPECQKLGSNSVAEPVLLASNVDKIGSSVGKDNEQDFHNLRMNESSKKPLAREDFETSDGKGSIKLLKRIKIEKP